MYQLYKNSLKTNRNDCAVKNVDLADRVITCLPPKTKVVPYLIVFIEQSLLKVAFLNHVCIHVLIERRNRTGLEC